MALERFVFNPQEFKKVFGRSPIYDTLILTAGGYIANRRAVAQGIGLHSKEQIEEFVTKNLRAVSTLLGNKTFILGEKPCQDDCAVFGQLAQAMWGLPNLNYERLVQSKDRTYSFVQNSFHYFIHLDKSKYLIIGLHVGTLSDELTNLRDYCLRMKEQYFQDWDKLTSRTKVN